MMFDSIDITTGMIVLLGGLIHFSVNRILYRLDMMDKSISRAHRRIDQHILDWHKDEVTKHG